MSGPGHLLRRNEFVIILLPEVVQIHICKFLNLGSLMNLRLTCKTLKAVIEKPIILQRLPIKVTFSKQLQKILDSDVPYNNFNLSFKSLDEQSYFNQFACRFGPFIRILTVTSYGGHLKTLALLQKCTQLRDLELRILDVDLIRRDQQVCDTVLKNLRNLQRLVIHDCRAEAFRGIEEVKTYLDIVRNCQKLIELKIPNIPSYNEKLLWSFFPDPINPNEPREIDEYNWEQEDALQKKSDPMPEWDCSKDKDVLIHPILDYIKDKTKNSKYRLQFLNVGSFTLFSWKTFSQLLQLCHEMKVQLMDIRTTQFRHLHNVHRNIDARHYEVIKSVQVTQMHKEFPFYEMNGIRELTLFLYPPEDDTGFGVTDHLSLPELEYLSVQFMIAGSDPQTDLVINKIFKDRQRKTVKKLLLEWKLLATCQTIRAVDIANNFRNVSELVIQGWDSTDKDFHLLWSNLHELESITIKDCKNITNKAFVGTEYQHDVSRRPINQLKKLHSVIIRDISGKVNEIAIMGAFRWIRLRLFEYDTTVNDLIRVDMYEHLVNSPLAQSVEYFFAPPPMIPKDYNFDEKFVARSFKNLKHRLFK